MIRLQRSNDAGADVEQANAQLPETEIVERGGEPIGGECDRFAARRPGGMQIGKWVGRQLLKRPRGERVDEEIGQTPFERGEYDPRPVRRPAWVVDLAQVLQGNFDALPLSRRIDNDQHGASLAQRRHREAAARWVPGAGRPDVLKAVEVRIRGGADDLANDGPRLRVGHEQVERQPIALRYEHQLATVGAQRGRQVQAGAVAGECRDAARHREPLLARVRRPGNGRVPLPPKLLPIQAGRLLEPGQRAARFRPQDAPQDVIAIPPRQVRPERVAVSIRKVARVVELLERRETAVVRRIAQPHRRMPVAGPEREVLGHAFDKPRRKREGIVPGALRDVDLERVRDFVAKHVVGRPQSGRKRHRNPRLRPLGEAACSLGRRPGRDVRLGEVGVAGVEHEGLPPHETVLQHLREARVPALRHARRVAGRVLFFGVVVDVEVFGLKNPEIEAVVADLVAAEVLGFGRSGTGKDRNQTDDGRRAPHHGHPWGYGIGDADSTMIF